MAKLVRNPEWNEDEHILALDLYLSKKPGQPQKSSPEVLELSVLLNRLHQKLGTQGQSTLRNPDGVYMKLMNLKSHDPEFVAKGRKGLPRGNQLEIKVWEEYGNEPSRLRKLAATIRKFIESDVSVPPVDAIDDDAVLAPEGRVLVRVHRGYERKAENRQEKVAAFRRAHNGRLFCECCAFDFEAVYGERGAGFIECHHVLPLSQLNPQQSLKLSDLALLCSNCHRMIHVRQPWLSVEELRILLRPLAVPALVAT